MGEAEDEDQGREHYFNHHPHPASTRPLAGPEEYHLFMWHNKHLLFELKLSVMVVLGGIIVLACVVYIVFQCRARARLAGQVPPPKEDEKELFGSTETLDNLLPAENCIRLKVRREQEFYV